MTQNITKELDDLVEYSLLYDFYGALLKENTRRIFEDYILNDLSLSEIAAEQGISRQGVHDVVKRSCKKLREYECKLGLLEKFNDTKKKVTKIHQTVGEIKESGDMNQLEKIERLSNQILEQM